MKVIFHGYSFIHYAPLYLLQEMELPYTIAFENPAGNDKATSFLEGNYKCTNNEIHILLLGQDRLFVSPFGDDFISVTKLIWQRPLAILRSTENRSGDWVNYRPGNSFNYLLNKRFSENKLISYQKLSNSSGIDVFNDEEFQLLQDGIAEYAITWNPWKICNYDKVKKVNIPYPILPFGWTCLIVKKEELKNLEKLNVIKELISNIYDKVFDIYKFYENKKFTGKNYNSQIKSLGELVKSKVKEEDKPHVAFALRKLAKSKVWFTNEIFRDNNLQDFSNYLVSETELSNNIIKKTATKAAISQVMARNTSHNIGAHVMNNLNGDLSKLNIKSFKNYKSDIMVYKSTDDNTKILLEQISTFNNYVKCRMDYLAGVSFGTPLMQTNKYAYEELFTGLDEVRLLLEHISGLDNFSFKIEFKKNGKTLDRENDILVAIPNDILGTQAFYNILENIIRNSAKHGDKSKLQNGQDIVFTVNFIDSIEEKTNDNISKVVDFCECSNVSCMKAHRKEIENALKEFIAVEVYDNILLVGTKKVIKLDEEELSEYKRMMSANKPNINTDIDYLVFNQNKKLNEDILQDNNLRSYSLGLVEMDASAAYLRKRPVEYINHHSYDIQYDESWSRNSEKNKESGKDSSSLRGSNCRHFIKAFKKTENGKNYLGYRFFLHRPAVVLVVTDMLIDDSVESHEKKKDTLRKEGAWVIGKTEFEKELEAGKTYPHEFILIDCNDNLECPNLIKLLESYPTSLPLRILKFKTGELKNILNNHTEEISVHCWNGWYNMIKELNKCNDHKDNHIDRFYSINGTFNPDVCHSIVLMDHLYKEDGDQDPEKAKKIWDDMRTKTCHIEALSSLGQSKLPDFYKTIIQKCKEERSIKKMLQCYLLEMSKINELQIIESAFTKVVVIDERIQAAAEKRDFMGIKFAELYKKMNVIVPCEKEINLSASSFDKELINNLKIYLGINNDKTDGSTTISVITSNLNKNDFILIHYSIFERMFKKENINSKLEEIANKGINVVITSGRGTPENLTSKVRFLNLSSVLNAFVDVRSKYLINYLLNSSRKSNKI